MFSVCLKVLHKYSAGRVEYEVTVEDFEPKGMGARMNQNLIARGLVNSWSGKHVCVRVHVSSGVGRTLPLLHVDLRSRRDTSNDSQQQGSNHLGGPGKVLLAGYEKNGKARGGNKMQNERKNGRKNARTEGGRMRH
mmetsp:Transcript_9459/g.18425  ORF Transcript_9459/g.18425 Transcript_9459/m.18425 type:complete len:136 (+) Transcript_9459:213-620(+)